MSSVDFSAQLNEEQLAAVQAPDGPVLIIAAAGTGKTRTLTYRVAYLVEQGINPERVLLLTFTNRAAGEMLDRARGLVGQSIGGLWGGTFHHMANRMLRRHADRLGFGSDYTILDQDDARRVMKQCTENLGLGGKQFPKPDVLLSLFGLSAGREQALETLAEERFEHHPVDPGDILRVHGRYQARKRELNGMDFDDLLVYGLALFRENPDILERYQDRFLYVLVDEYQDTNRIQAEWVDRVSAGRRNLLVVGDDFQSIYSWRGADFTNILSFPKRYADTQIFKLETNYRSIPGILDVANACIAANPEQFQKELRAVRKSLVKPQVVELRDGGAQARFVIEEIRRLRRQGVPASDIAVLYRAHFQAMELQLELAREQLPYVITSGVRFFEQAHIKDVCSLVRVLHAPGDELAFLRLLTLLPKVGPKTADRIWKKLGGRFRARNPEQRKQLLEALPAVARERWAPVDPILAAYFEEGLDQDPGEVIHRYTEAFYGDFAVETFDNADRRMEDIQELVLFTARFPHAEAFLNEVALLTNLDAEASPEQEQAGEAVRLTTVHQAKGLEWPVVFVLWMADGMFPSGRSMQETGGEAEERRLFYVASTRAKDALYLMVPRMRRARDGSLAYYSPSRFLGEIPEELFERRAQPYA